MQGATHPTEEQTGTDCAACLPALPYELVECGRLPHLHYSR